MLHYAYCCILILEQQQLLYVFLTLFSHYGNKWLFKRHQVQITALENTGGRSIKDKELLNKSHLSTCHIKQFLCQVADVYDGA